MIMTTLRPRLRRSVAGLGFCLLTPLALAGDPLLEVHGFLSSEMGSAIGIGDFNGDGIEDIAAAAREDESFGPGGATYLWNGADGSLLQHFGISSNEGYAISLDAIADLDGDGRDEVLVGAWLADGNGQNSGRVYIHSGADGSILDVLDGPLTGGTFGYDLTRMGDVNADGIEDFVVGAPNEQGGVVYCYSGADRGLLWQASGTAGDFFSEVGRLIACVGDVNGDGVSDLGSGRRNESTAANFAGRTTIYSGVDGTILHEFFGAAESDYCGDALAAAGDLDGDGLGDIAVSYSGVDQPQSLSGLVRIHSGADGSVLREYSGWADDALAGAFADCGDVNGDGVPDLAMTAPRASLGSSLAGAVRVHSGLDGSLLQLHWATQGSGFGSALTTIGDRDGDGARELVVGFPGDRNLLGLPGGSVRLHSTRPSTASQTCVGPVLPCPCGNTDGVGGCRNSSGQGARLLAMGSTSQALDAMSLLAFGMPPAKFGLGFVGTPITPVPFGAGVLCAGGPIQRLPVVNTGPGGAFRYDGGLVSTLGLTGQTSTLFQVWYRDPFGPCGAAFNTSGGLVVSWQP
jgi:hypothetical protein